MSCPWSGPVALIPKQAITRRLWLYGFPSIPDQARAPLQGIHCVLDRQRLHGPLFWLWRALLGQVL